LIWHQMRLKLLMGDVDGASKWVCGDSIPGDWSMADLPIAFHEFHQVLQARIMLAQERFQDVPGVWQSIMSTARPAGRMARVIEMDLYRALAFYALGEIDAALSSLAACLSLAVEEAYVRLFVEAGEPIRALLEHAFARGMHPDYARKLLSALEPPRGDTGQSNGQTDLVEALTDREVEVLRFICQGYTNAQIAEALIVATNTIKTHTSNLYGKLGVRNRAQAVLRAQELHFI
jgi:LuxR family maltose regulon positive regulatory protein